MNVKNMIKGGLRAAAGEIRVVKQLISALLFAASANALAVNEPPTVSLAASPASPVAPAALTFTASAADSDGSIAKVEFFNGDMLMGTVTQAPYTYTWTDVGTGSYVLTARATDNLGETTLSSPVTVAVGGVAPEVYFVDADQINTPRQISNQAGQTVWKIDLEPFGANLPDENPVGQGAFTYNLRFPGQYFDRETGLHYNYYRDYDPQTGRYVQSDPIGLAGGINTYGYVDGNPISSVDPEGLKIVPMGTLSEQARIRQGIQDLSRASSSAAKMIAQLEASSRVLTIEVGCESDHYGADKNGDAKDDHITWNPNKNHNRDGSEDWHYRPSYIGLGHEMIHAWAEYGTVGIPRKSGKPTAQYPYTENKFRSECGCSKQRKDY
jgi:RHS repeat-associated protein